MNFTKHQYMGVMNLTPNSFSDGGELHSCEMVLQRAHGFYKKGVRVFDFGAQSTAPFNDPISQEEEIQRFEKLLFPLIKKLPIDCVYSIDTYHPETFSQVADYFKNHCLWWNDVSGVVDERTLQVIKHSKPERYILCHNLAPTRELSHRHMDYVTREVDLVSHQVDFFKERLKRLKDIDVILDPCFGFSKTREQNLQLMEELPVLLDKFSQNAFLIGISKKSFLRPLDKHLKNTEEAFRAANKKQKEYIHLLKKNRSEQNLIFRVHHDFASEF